MNEEMKWIKEGGSCEIDENMISGLLSKLSPGYHSYVSFYTNRLAAGVVEKGTPIPLIDDLVHLLEIRVFNEAEELHAVRTAIGKPFKWRIAAEVDMDDSVYYKEERQLLDIDRKRDPEQGGGNTAFYATGGGKYPLPVPRETDSVELVNYFRFDKSGNLQFADYRIKRFFCGAGIEGKE